MVSFTPFVSNPNGHFGAPVAVEALAPVVDAPAPVAVAVEALAPVVDAPAPAPVAVEAPAPVPARPAPKRAIKGKLATVVEKA